VPGSVIVWKKSAVGTIHSWDTVYLLKALSVFMPGSNKF